MREFELHVSNNVYVNVRVVKTKSIEDDMQRAIENIEAALGVTGLGHFDNLKLEEITANGTN